MLEIILLVLLVPAVFVLALMGLSVLVAYATQRAYDEDWGGEQDD
jgi:hypothetical protein